MRNNKLNVEDSFILAEKILQKIMLSLVRKVENQLHGDYKSIFHGHGLDFKEIREYSINDDIRNLDWNVTARMGEPHVRVYEEERDNTVWLILDVSSSMDFGSRFTSKKDVLVKFAALMGYLSCKKGDKIGAILFNEGVETVISPEKGIKQVYKIIKQLLEYKAEGKKASNMDFARITNITGKKKTLFFMSDFVFPNLSWKKAFGELAVKNELTVVHILDPVEESLPEVGYINLYDPETGKKLVFDASNTRFRQKYQEYIDEENKKINDTFHTLRLDPVKIYTNSDIAQVLVDYSRKIIIRR